MDDVPVIRENLGMVHEAYFKELPKTGNRNDRTEDVSIAAWEGFALLPLNLTPREFFMSILIKATVPLALLAMCTAVYADSETPKAKQTPDKVQPVPMARVMVGALGGGNGGTAETLLRNKSVQEELKLSEEQIASVTKAWGDANVARVALFKGLQGLNRQERQKKLAEVTKKVRKAQDDAGQAAKKALNPKQVQRLNQIFLQRRGTLALQDDGVVKQLELTEEQQAAIKSKIEDRSKQHAKLMQAVQQGNVARRDLQAKRQDLEKEHEKQTLEVLTPAQQAKYKQILGDEFKMPLRVAPAVRLQVAPRPVRGKPAGGGHAPAQPLPRQKLQPKAKNKSDL